MPIFARKGPTIQKPEVDLLVARALLHDGGLGTVLGPGNLQPTIAERQIIGGMKRHRALCTNDDRAAAKRRQIVDFIGERCDTSGRRLL